MKRLSPFSVAVFAVLFVVFTLPVLAEDDSLSFVIAPPPVGYPEFEIGQKLIHTGGNLVYLNMDVMDEKVFILGGSGFGNYQLSLTDRTALNGSLGGSLLVGTEHNLLIAGVPLQMNVVTEPLRNDLLSVFLFGGVGGTLGTSHMIVTVPQFVPPSTFIDDDTSVDTVSVSGLLNCGAQLNISYGDFIVSPFGIWSYSGGTYWSTQTSTMSYDYPSTSGAIEGYTSMVLGFDVLYTPLDISLSSQLMRTDRYTMVSLAVKWLYRRLRTAGTESP